MVTGHVIPAGALALCLIACGARDAPQRTAVPVVVDAVEVRMASAAEVRVTLQGSLPSSCATLDEISTEHDGSRFLVLLRASQPVRAACAPVMTPFEETLLLEVARLGPGRYHVEAQGRRASFELPGDTPEDGAPSDQGPKDDVPEDELPAAPDRSAAVVRVSSVAAERSPAPPYEVPPYEVTLRIRGTLPNPCVRIDRAQQERQASHVEVVLKASAPATGACPDVLASFEWTLVLDATGLGTGRYTVGVHGATAVFALP